MFDNDIMTVNASEVLQKVPSDEKDYHKCFRLWAYSASTRLWAYSVEKIDVNIAPKAKLKETARDILKFLQKNVQ